MYTPQELYEKKWLRVNTGSWDAHGSFRINGIYQAAGLDFWSLPLNFPLSRGQIMEVARITLPILEQQERATNYNGGDA